MSVQEEAGKVATSAIDALKGSPTCLAAILLAALFSVLTFFAYQRDADRRSAAVNLLINRCFDPDHKDYHPPHEAQK
jgi:hypothetical protein